MPLINSLTRATGGHLSLEGTGGVSANPIRGRTEINLSVNGLAYVKYPIDASEGLALADDASLSAKGILTSAAGLSFISTTTVSAKGALSSEATITITSAGKANEISAGGAVISISSQGTLIARGDLAGRAELKILAGFFADIVNEQDLTVVCEDDLLTARETSTLLTTTINTPEVVVSVPVGRISGKTSIFVGEQPPVNITPTFVLAAGTG